MKIVPVPPTEFAEDELFQSEVAGLDVAVIVAEFNGDHHITTYGENMAESQLRQIFDGLRAIIVEGSGSPELQAFRSRLAIMAIFKLVTDDLCQMAEFDINTSKIKDAAANLRAGRNMLAEYWSGVKADFSPRDKSPLTTQLQLRSFDENGEILEWKLEPEVRIMVLKTADKVAERLDKAAKLLEEGNEKASRRALKTLAGTTDYHLYKVMTAYSEEWLRCSVELQNV